MTSLHASAPALSGITVFEIDVGPAGQYAGRLLASLGATVFKFEPLTGDPFRGMPPFAHDRHGDRRSMPFEYFNAGKHSVSLDLEDPLCIELIASHRGTPAIVLASPEQACRLPPSFNGVQVAVSPFGALGNATSTSASSPLTRYQAGGDGYLLPCARPTAPGSFVGDCFAGSGVALCAISLLYDRESLADAGKDASASVDFSEQAHSVNLQKMFVAHTIKNGVALDNRSHSYPYGGSVRCSDGFVSMLANEEHQWRGICAMMEKPEWIGDPAFGNGVLRRERQQEIREALDKTCGRRTVSEVIELARENNVPIGRVSTPAEVLRNRNLERRGFYVRALTDLGELQTIGLPFGPRFHAAVSLGLAPRLGEHTAAWLTAIGKTRQEIDRMENLGLSRCECGPPTAAA